MEDVITPVGIYDIEHRQIHVIGAHVAVCYALEAMQDVSTEAQSPPTTPAKPVPFGDPYVAFLEVYQAHNGTWHSEEPDLLSRHLAPADALAVATELQRAVQYCAQLVYDLAGEDRVSPDQGWEEETHA